MSSTTYRVIKSVNSLPPTSNANARETLGSRQAFSSHIHSGINKATTFKDYPNANNGQTVASSKTSQNKDGHDAPYPASQLTDNLIEKTNITDIKNKHYFLKLAIPAALSFWVLDSFIHYYWYGELEFEIIPTDMNDLWMRSCIVILLVAFGFFADYKSKKSITRSIINNQLDNISRAKKQWELVIDTLPQLVIAMDENAKITRVNRTVEAWGIAQVNKVDGLFVSDFLKCLNDNHADDDWTSDWPYIWQQIKNRDTIERKIEKEHSGKIFQYSLRKIPDYDIKKDQCYAVLIIDDITARQSVEKSLKNYTQELEKDVNERTLELKHANSQLEHELQVQKRAKKELKESQQCRLGLLRELLTTQEMERKRIASELHDSIGQSIGATKFKLEELLINKQNIPDFDYDEFTKVVRKLQSIIQDVRHISMDLRPALLDDLGTIMTLSWFCREFENTYTGISVKQIINADESDISEDRKIVIFRIVQEAMNNIAKHANAENIVLELNNSDSGLTMSISDDGCGFNKNLLIKKNVRKLSKDNNTPKCSFGLSSMRERAESTHGDFLIETIPNIGTRVNISWKNQ
jgi:PAS domain S-box-containing protein